MTKSVFTVELDLDPAAAFDFLADLRNTPTWDPPVQRAELESHNIGPGARFSVWLKFIGIPLRTAFELVEYDRPRKLALRGVNKAARIADEIVLEPLDGTRTRVWTQSTVRLRGLLVVVSPLVKLFGPLLAAAATRALQRRTASIAGTSADTTG